jgi:hypothetical protein
LKINSTISLYSIALLLGLFGCVTHAGLSPGDVVPKRNALPHDAYGGYITVQTSDSSRYSGELIGMRNDSIIVLAQMASSILLKNVSNARIIVHSPNQYGFWMLLGLPNLLMLTAQCDDCGSPAPLALFLTVIDAVGVSFAAATEKKKIPYFDWTEGWMEVMKYSRFPSGIPQHIKLSELKGREIKSVSSKQ